MPSVRDGSSVELIAQLGLSLQSVISDGADRLDAPTGSVGVLVSAWCHGYARHFINCPNNMLHLRSHFKRQHYPAGATKLVMRQIVECGKRRGEGWCQVLFPYPDEVDVFMPIGCLLECEDLLVELNYDSLAAFLRPGSLEMEDFKSMITRLACLSFPKPIRRNDGDDRSNGLNPRRSVGAAHGGIGARGRGKNERQRPDCANETRKRERKSNDEVSGQLLNFHEFSAVVPRHITAAEGAA
ncbi:hypothetical protein AXYL_02052 [Achromobacter xylosoxidans A8]|uniref:Uncharacterized protein n=1 Tax=Achromobacter xylosoxidans (strain A8) TaxID=762376 RepID=E3HGP5_ACHXA|nr:hypothetical protein AXYL_02052 [Achromobacter xylosoxidans A8]